MSRDRLSAQVSSWHPSTNEVTATSLLSTVVPYGLRLRHTILGGQITNITTSAGVITYTCQNNFSAGDVVTITGVNPSAFNLTNVTVLASGLSSTQFRISNAATGTYVSGGDVTTSFQIPNGINWIYAIVVGGGGAGNTSVNNSMAGGGAGGVSWGWTPAVNTCIVGSGGPSAGTSGNYSRYGNIIAAGGTLSIGGGAASNSSTGYWGMPGGVVGTSSSTGNGGNGTIGAGGGSGAASTFSGGNGGNGANGISGGGGGDARGTGSFTQAGGNGGSGLVGGGGGGVFNTIGDRIGGKGGNGIGIDGTIYTGGTGTTGTNTNGAGGGGAGIAGNGGNASGTTGGAGGLGGGGGGGGNAPGGNGLIYIYY